MSFCIILFIPRHMISLHDQISKFQKMVYNKQLAQYVTVDQMFVGGGITIESIIHENSFMIEQLKKMNAVFRNFCKLNEKVYSKIIEHELSIHNEHTKFSGLTSLVERKFDDTTKLIKELYEATVMQNQKSLRAMDDVLKPIKGELQKKVDEKTFTSKMKHILDQYDEGGLNEQEHQEDEEGHSPTHTSVGQNNHNSVYNTGSNGTSSPLKKGGQEQSQQVATHHKKGKVGFDQFFKMKDELQNRLKACEIRIIEMDTGGLEMKQMLMKYIPIINKTSSDMQSQATNIQKVNFEQTEKIINLNNSINKLYVQLNDRINEDIWINKFQIFSAKEVKPIFKTLQQSLSILRNQLKDKQLESTVKFKNVEASFASTHILISQANTLIKRNKEQIDIVNFNIKENQKLNQNEHKNISNQIDAVSNSLQSTFKKIEAEMKQNSADFKQIIDNLSNTISQLVLKTVNKKIAGQLKVIEKDIQQNRSKIKQIKEDSMILCDQIKNIKEVLSSKANFSDIIQHVEKKADKEDFKELQIQLNESSPQKSIRRMHESFNIQKMEKVDSMRRVHSSSRNTKTMFGHLTPSKIELDSPTKIFMCGFDEHMSENKKMVSQHSRRHRLRSSNITGELT